MVARYYLCLFWVVLGLNSCPVLGQKAVLQPPSEGDYALWGKLEVHALSEGGNWSSYSMRYEHKKDTLFVQHQTGTRRFAFAKGVDGRFIAERAFVYKVADTMHVLVMANNKRWAVTGVTRYEVVKGNVLLSYTRANALELHTLTGEKLAGISDVVAYQVNPAGTAVVYTRKNQGRYEVGCLEFANTIQKVLLTDDASFGRFNWQANDKSVVFGHANAVGLYRFADHRLFSLDVSALPAYEGAVMATGGYTNLVVSDDGKKVFFSIVNKVDALPKSPVTAVEVWNGNDDSLFPSRQLRASVAVPKLTVWFPEQDRCKVLSDSSRLDVRLTSSGDYVLLSDPNTHLRKSYYPKRVDYYIKDVRTGAEKLFLEAHSKGSHELSMSPFGSAILYYRDAHWWWYDPVTDVQISLTEGVTNCWDATDAGDPAQSGAYGVAGYTSDGKFVLLYDRYDLWKMALDGSGCQRLTNGRENDMVYRLSKSNFEEAKAHGYEGVPRIVVALSKGIVLEVTHTLDGATGYGLYDNKKGYSMLVYGSKKYRGIKRIASGTYLFTSETFAQSPQLELCRNEGMKVLFKSNLHQARFVYGRSELVHYTNSRGEQLQGALFYPAGYEAGKKYPMVVKIYERQSGMVHHYVVPTLSNGSGFNASVFTAKGYFVLLPDIQYEKGNTGLSAYDCVTAAVTQVVATHGIDATRIGLMGHSFGGYETDFILTQTTMFAAAVSGAGIGNTVGFYFSLNTNGGGAEDGMWRFENQQQRMGVSFYDDKEAYLRNSPLYHADKIKTPLLFWTGKTDVVVPYEQSVNLYLALRKLRAKTILLAYPEEGHSLNKEANQQDLTTRIVQWFDYYLKGETDVGWISVGTSEE